MHDKAENNCFVISFIYVRILRGYAHVFGARAVWGELEKDLL